MKPNWSNRTIWTGDNLAIMRGMNSESVDLIYLDPPFNSKRTYSAPIGSKAAGAAFKDTWTLDDVDVAWHGEIAEQNPARLCRNRRGWHCSRAGDEVIPHHDGREALGNAPSLETNGKPLPALRPDGRPLPENAYGFCVWSGKVPE